ncbi:DUF368 domain-containing protein [Pseudomonas sp. NW5]|uniref:DUF368 domain-containing protein n=1 Tax=Pseudomonas sp. NW5 TaxID=2934934 RepID=UPI002021E30A|nr:DUF368 domain-containing protein [Pseudomonas sp. NW5]MCL7462026.1 DUF368 domain-containing protein [Pseudomonas sp. NW5]
MHNPFLLFAKGMAMGAADVVPGVSGGTIAFITGIYDELLRSIAQVPLAARQLLRWRLREAWQTANARFLLVLLGGILCSILTLARLIGWLLVHQPILLWSFFFGLILVSVWLVGRQISRWHLPGLLSLLAGTLGAWWITVAAPMQWGHDPLSLVLAGAIAICAMILPGISGSFLLVLMGLYGFILEALISLNLGVLALFAVGCLGGLLSFAHLLSWLLQHARNLTLSFLTGLMIGSLNKVWPWKETLSWRTDRHGVQQPLLEQAVLPERYALITGQDPQFWPALALALAAVALVLGLEFMARRPSLRHEVSKP